MRHNSQMVATFKRAISHRCVLVRILTTGDGELNMEQVICLSSLESRLYGAAVPHEFWSSCVHSFSTAVRALPHIRVRSIWMQMTWLIGEFTSVLSVLNYRWEQIGFCLACSHASILGSTCTCTSSYNILLCIALALTYWVIIPSFDASHSITWFKSVFVWVVIIKKSHSHMKKNNLK